MSRRGWPSADPGASGGPQGAGKVWYVKWFDFFSWSNLLVYGSVTELYALFKREALSF